MIKRILISIFLLLVFIPSQVFALSTTDQQSLNGDSIYYWPNQTTGGTCATSSVSLVGNDNIQKAFNFFVSQGLSAPQAAGVVGNLIQESGVNPEEIQGGGQSQDPAAAGSGGWGIAQWTPGAKVIDIAKSLNITGPIYDLGIQLNIVWNEMTGTSPTGAQNMANGLKQITDVNQAAEYFEQYFEEGPVAASGGGQLANRQSFARQVLQQYGGAAVTTGTTSTTSVTPGCGGGTVSCSGTAVSGDAGIACDVLKYDTLSYSQAWHSSGSVFHSKCSTIGPQCATDCSGLVNIALYDLFNNDMNENTFAEAADTTNFKQIPFSQVQPGDLIQPNPDHVEIIESVNGNTLNTFAAHTDQVPQPDQVGPAQYTNAPGYVYLRYIGPGSGGS